MGVAGTYGPNANGVAYVITQTGSTYKLTIYENSTLVKTVGDLSADDIVTTSGSTLNIASLLSNTTYVVVPGVSVNLDFGLNLASASTIYLGGTATITAIGSVLSSVTVDVQGGDLTASSGLVASALSGLTVNLSYGGAFGNGNGLISLLSNTKINYGTGGGTFIANAGGKLINLSGLSITGFGSSADKIEFENVTAPLQSYTISYSFLSNSETITLYSDKGHTAEIGSVTIKGKLLDTGAFVAGGTGPLGITESGSGTDWKITFDPAPGSTVPCFLGQTRIATPDGMKPVEGLKIGDLVLTDDGAAVPVRWIGRRTVSTVFADPLRVMPVRIRAGALGDNLPLQDLLISPDHALLIGDVLTNAGALVNGVSILREREMPRNFVYYHVEVDAHALILAEGVSAETFIDHVDRMAFDNWAEHAAIFGDAPEKPEMSYPRVKSARQLPRSIRLRLDAHVADGGRTAA